MVPSASMHRGLHAAQHTFSNIISRRHRAFIWSQSDDEPAGYYDHAAGEDDISESKGGRK